MTTFSETDHATRTLPTGADGALWTERVQCGILEFRGSMLRIEIPVSSEVLFPTDCGLSLLAALDADTMSEFAGLRALDIGAGSGLYSIALLLAGAAEVTALDINPHAGVAVRRNAEHNGVDLSRLSCVTSDIAQYAPDAPFDLVVANPPHLPLHHSYASGDGLETALVGGPNGRAVYDAILARVDALIKPGGRLVMCHSSLTNVAKTKAQLAARGFRCRTVSVFDMDIPLRAYAAHTDQLMAELRRLRHGGEADFDGDRFSVHVLEFRR